jgi:endonuclease-3 related protein
MPRAGRRALYLRYFRAMHRRYGPQGWWPARSKFEVIVGAILTQNTAWRNVEKGIEVLRARGLLEPRAMGRVPPARLAALIRPTGYFNQKAARLRGFLFFLRTRHGGDLDRMLAQPPDLLRRQLLDLPGIGPETADAILLYAAGAPVFVVDAYTRRILGRHALLPADGAAYEAIREQLQKALPASAALFNEYHALLVRVGKEHCFKDRPRCLGCPLEPLLPEAPVPARPVPDRPVRGGRRSRSPN